MIRDAFANVQSDAHYISETNSTNATARRTVPAGHIFSSCGIAVHRISSTSAWKDGAIDDLAALIDRILDLRTR